MLVLRAAEAGGALEVHGRLGDHLLVAATACDALSAGWAAGSLGSSAPAVRAAAQLRCSQQVSAQRCVRKLADHRSCRTALADAVFFYGLLSQSRRAAVRERSSGGSEADERRPVDGFAEDESRSLLASGLQDASQPPQSSQKSAISSR